MFGGRYRSDSCTAACSSNDSPLPKAAAVPSTSRMHHRSRVMARRLYVRLRPCQAAETNGNSKGGLAPALVSWVSLYSVVTQTFSMTTGVVGLSIAPVWTFSSFSSTSMPSVSWPMTVYWPSSCGVGPKQM